MGWMRRSLSGCHLLDPGGPCPIISTWLDSSAEHVSSPPTQNLRLLVPSSLSQAHRPFVRHVLRPLVTQALCCSRQTQARRQFLGQARQPPLTQARRSLLPQAQSPLQSPLRSRSSQSPLQSPLRSRSSQSPLQSTPKCHALPESPLESGLPERPLESALPKRPRCPRFPSAPGVRSSRAPTRARSSRAPTRARSSRVPPDIVDFPNTFFWGAHGVPISAMAARVWRGMCLLGGRGRNVRPVSPCLVSPSSCAHIWSFLFPVHY